MTLAKGGERRYGVKSVQGSAEHGQHGYQYAY